LALFVSYFQQVSENGQWCRLVCKTDWCIPDGGAQSSLHAL